MVALNSGRSLLSSHDRDAASEREQEKETDILRAQLALAEERAKALEEQIEREKEREERASEREREHLQKEPAQALDPATFKHEGQVYIKLYHHPLSNDQETSKNYLENGDSKAGSVVTQVLQ